MAQPDLAALVNAVVDDPEVKTLVKALAMDALSEARDLIEHGNPQTKANLIRALMPALVQSLKETNTGDGLEELKKNQTALFAAMKEA